MLNSLSWRTTTQGIDIISNETHSYRILLFLCRLFANSEYPSFNLTKLDILGGLQTIKVAVTYRLPDSRDVTRPPTNLNSNTEINESACMTLQRGQSTRIGFVPEEALILGQAEKIREC